MVNICIKNESGTFTYQNKIGPSHLSEYTSLRKAGTKSIHWEFQPCMIEMQTLYALALEPIAETKADTISFGFRHGRSTKDACEQIFCILARKCSPTWILEGDIKGCFDNINHEWLIANIPMDKRIMMQFLKSGFIYEDKLFPTETGSPQGGAISSLYANMTLDGLEKVIQDKYHQNSKSNIENHFRAKTKVNLVRYADDFIITVDSRETAESKNVVSSFLKSRGANII